MLINLKKVQSTDFTKQKQCCFANLIDLSRSKLPNYFATALTQIVNALVFLIYSKTS